MKILEIKAELDNVGIMRAKGTDIMRVLPLSIVKQMSSHLNTILLERSKEDTMAKAKASTKKEVKKPAKKAAKK